MKNVLATLLANRVECVYRVHNAFAVKRKFNGEHLQLRPAYLL